MLTNRVAMMFAVLAAFFLQIPETYAGNGGVVIRQQQPYVVPQPRYIVQQAQHTSQYQQQYVAHQPQHRQRRRAAGSAWAPGYRCVINGQPVYQRSTCLRVHRQARRGRNGWAFAQGRGVADYIQNKQVRQRVGRQQSDTSVPQVTYHPRRQVNRQYAGSCSTGGGHQCNAAASGHYVGVLKCRFNGSDAAIHFGAKRYLSCTFVHRYGSRKERYLGIVEKYGIEVGIIGKQSLRWKVTSRRYKRLPRGALTGSYRGATAEASIGTGFAANLLTGGPNKSVELQPVAFQSQDGLNVAAGYLILTLKRYR